MTSSGRPSKRPRDPDDDAQQPADSFGHVRNKIRRGELARRLIRAKKKIRAQQRRQRQREVQEGAEDSKPRQPRTLESARELDETQVDAADEEVRARDEEDEFAGVFNGTTRPRLLLSTGKPRPTRTSYGALAELLRMIPHSAYWKRPDGCTIKNMAKHAIDKGYTDLLVLKEDGKRLTSLTHIHLPEGPSAVYRLTSFVPSSKIRGHGTPTDVAPEVIVNNFTTALGHRVGRMLASLCPQITTQSARGRQVLTWHNQRDFIFCRLHRYIFKKNGETAGLQELGPRFTLKLQALHHGIMNPKNPKYEWVLKKEMETSRRKFFL